MCSLTVAGGRTFRAVVKLLYVIHGAWMAGGMVAL